MNTLDAAPLTDLTHQATLAAPSPLTALTGTLEVALTWLLAALLATTLYWAISINLERRKRDPAERALLFVAYLLLALGGAALTLDGHEFTVARPLLAALPPLLALFFFFLFSDSRFASVRVRWLALIFIINRLFLYAPTNNNQTTTHISLPGLAGFVLTMSAFGAITLMVIALPRQVYLRYAQRPIVGAQTRHSARWWWGMATLLCVAGYLPLVALVAMSSAPWASAPLPVAAAGAVVYGVCALAPLTLSYALARGQALDRDALRNRALRYGALAGALLAFYGVAASVLWFGVFGGYYLRALASAAYLPFIIIVGLLMAYSYRRLRAWLDERIDARFFPRRARASHVFAAFHATTPGEGQLDQFASSLTLTIQKAFAPEGVALWLPTLAAPSATSALALQPTPPAPASAALATRSQAQESRGGEWRGEGGAPVATLTATDTPPLAPATPAAPLVRLRWHAGEPRAPGGVTGFPLAPGDPDAAALSRPGALTLGPTDSLADGPTDGASVALEALRHAGMRLAVPLMSPTQGDGAPVGLLTLGPLSGAPATADERELLSAFAAQVAPMLAAAQQAQESRVAARERERAEQELLTARRIQESLLPKTTPTLAGWRLATCYQPAREVGGDFYDFITLPDGRLGLALGDVTDKGIPAALVMATTRSMLRAVAQHTHAPGDALAQVNNLLCADLPPSMFVTCFYAILDPASGRLRFANAGQDLPYARVAGQETRELRARGMPLGLMPDMPYEEGEVTLQPGESVLFYSDGLVEAHDPTRQMFGFPRLMSLLDAYNEDAPPIIYLLHALMAFTGPDWEQEDDITLVTLQRTEQTGEASMSGQVDGQVDGQADGRRSDATSAEAEGWRLLARHTLPSAPGGEREAMRLVVEALRGVDLAPERVERLQTAVSEAVMNAMEYGGRFQADSPVTIETLASSEAAQVRVTDEGSAFALPDPVAPDLDAKLAGLQSPRGWGLFLIERLMDEVRVTGDERHHTIEMTLRLHDDEGRNGNAGQTPPPATTDGLK